MAQAREYPCGCIIHDLAGKVRNCPGLPSRSMSGRVVSPDDASAKRHEEGMNAPDHKVIFYPVADIVR